MIIYDAGALVAAERNIPSLWALHDAVLRRGLSPLVPAGVLARVLRAVVVTGDVTDLNILARAAGWSMTLHQV